jgi:hypothetical protein
MANPSWAPTTAEVAALAGGAYARELGSGFDGTVEQVDDFTASTEPSKTQVEAFITAGCDELTGQLPDAAVPTSLQKLAHVAVQWFGAAQVHAVREDSDGEPASGAYRAAIANYRVNAERVLELTPRFASRLQ